MALWFCYGGGNHQYDCLLLRFNLGVRDFSKAKIDCSLILAYFSTIANGLVCFPVTQMGLSIESGFVGSKSFSLANQKTAARGNVAALG